MKAETLPQMATRHASGIPDAPRIDADERIRFHMILDAAIDKMNAPKNAKKPKWYALQNTELVELLLVEAFELRHAVLYPHHGNVSGECKDVINYALMIADNAARGK